MKFFFPPLLYNVQREGDLSLELLPFKNRCLFVCVFCFVVFLFLFLFFVFFFCQGKIFNYMFRINGACVIFPVICCVLLNHSSVSWDK